LQSPHPVSILWQLFFAISLQCHPSDPDFVEELEARNAEAKGMLEALRDIEGTLRGLDQGKIRIQ
jgi:hypothetical protein